MSRNEKPQTSKNKHYTLIERKIFLQILEKYKNVIEVKVHLRKSTSKQVPPKVPIKKRKHQEVSYQETEDNLRVQRI